MVEVHVVGTDVTELVRMQRKLELYSVEVQKAHEAERLNLSRLIHDDSVQSLLGVSRLLGSVMTQHRRELPQAVLGKLEEMRGILSTQVESLRGLSLILRPPILDKMGLDAAVRWLTRTVCDAHGIEGKVVIGGGWIRCSPDLELPLFRIIQEAVNNAVRHGHPRSIEISMDIAEGWLRVSIHDDGQGFDNAKTETELLLQGKLGLVGMQERARELGAKVVIDTIPGSGTWVRLAVPVIGNGPGEAEVREVTEK